MELDAWYRQYQMATASETPGSTTTPPSDSGPSFTMTSVANNAAFNCTPSGKQSDVFKGDCTSTASGSSANGLQASFEFGPALNILTVREDFNCDAGSSFDAVGIAYIQAGCARAYNSHTYSCRSGPVWMGNGIV